MDVLLLSSDLMTTSQIEAAVRAAGGGISVATTGIASHDAEKKPVDVAILDLSTTSDVAGTVAHLRELSPPPRIIAFGPHVHAGKLSAAREAGCDQVLTRGQFLPNVAQALELSH